MTSARLRPVLCVVTLTTLIAFIAPARAGAAPPKDLDKEDEAFLDDLQRRAFLYFWEQADPRTGLVRDRAGADGEPTAAVRSRHVASIAATGFGLTGIGVAERRGWVARDEAYGRALATVRFLAEKMPHHRGFFYHFVDMRTGQRVWDCELSSIDTALLMAGVLTVRQHYKGTEVER